MLREHREKARLKFLFLRHGWTAERFLAEVEARLGYALDRAPQEPRPEEVYRDHVGIHPQRQPDLCYAGATVLRGRLTAAQLRAVADAAERHGDGQARTTTMQNVVVVNVRRERVGALARELAQAGLPTGGSPFRRVSRIPWMTARSGRSLAPVKRCSITVIPNGSLIWTAPR